MKRIRLATQEEIDKIRPTADLDPTCIVLALDTAIGPFVCVVRTAIEVDPVYSPEGCTDRQKAMFMRDVETTLAAKGASTYYYNVDASDEQWQKNIQSWGAEKVSLHPEIRFKVTL